ncbi:hypothetical protein U1Q18_023913 [Sarracenia purpurea var. burkii]
MLGMEKEEKHKISDSIWIWSYERAQIRKAEAWIESRETRDSIRTRCQSSEPPNRSAFGEEFWGLGEEGARFRKWVLRYSSSSNGNVQEGQGSLFGGDKPAGASGLLPQQIHNRHGKPHFVFSRISKR